MYASTAIRDEDSSESHGGKKEEKWDEGPKGGNQANLQRHGYKGPGLTCAGDPLAHLLVQDYV